MSCVSKLKYTVFVFAFLGVLFSREAQASAIVKVTASYSGHLLIGAGVLVADKCDVNAQALHPEECKISVLTASHLAESELTTVTIYDDHSEKFKEITRFKSKKSDVVNDISLLEIDASDLKIDESWVAVPWFVYSDRGAFIGNFRTGMGLNRKSLFPVIDLYYHAGPVVRNEELLQVGSVGYRLGSAANTVVVPSWQERPASGYSKTCGGKEFYTGLGEQMTVPSILVSGFSGTPLISEADPMMNTLLFIAGITTQHDRYFRSSYIASTKAIDQLRNQTNSKKSTGLDWHWKFSEKFGTYRVSSAYSEIPISKLPSGSGIKGDSGSGAKADGGSFYAQSVDPTVGLTEIVDSIEKRLIAFKIDGIAVWADVFGTQFFSEQKVEKIYETEFSLDLFSDKISRTKAASQIANRYSSVLNWSVNDKCNAKLDSEKSELMLEINSQGKVIRIVVKDSLKLIRPVEELNQTIDLRGLFFTDISQVPIPFEIGQKLQIRDWLKHAKEESPYIILQSESSDPCSIRIRCGELP